MSGATRYPVDSASGAQPLIPLAMVGAGETVELVRVHGGTGLVRHLAEMGLGPGTRFAVETRGRPGPFVVRVKGSRLILGHGMVSRMLVRPVQSNELENEKR
jgi:Fe2+ transport system protein FeoA